MTTILAATLPRILLQGPSWYVRTPQSIGLNGLKRPLVEGSGHKVELVISSVESPDGSSWHWVQDPLVKQALDLCFTE